MRRLVPILFALLTASVAQSPAGQIPATFPIPATNFGCPVGFAANRQPGIGQAMSAADQKQPGPAQGLHLTLSRPSMGDIQSIDVTVYATSTKLRALPLDSQSDDTISKTFTLTREAGTSSLN